MSNLTCLSLQLLAPYLLSSLAPRPSCADPLGQVSGWYTCLILCVSSVLSSLSLSLSLTSLFGTDISFSLLCFLSSPPLHSLVSRGKESTLWTTADTSPVCQSSKKSSSTNIQNTHTHTHTQL